MVGALGPAEERGVGGAGVLGVGRTGRGLDPSEQQGVGGAEVLGGAEARRAGRGLRRVSRAALRAPPSPAEARAHPSAPEPAVPARGDGAGVWWGGSCAPAAEEGGAAAQGVQLREPQVSRPGGVRPGGAEAGNGRVAGGKRG